MVPGIEGTAGVLKSLSKRLKCKATVLQLGYDQSFETVEEMAHRLLLVIFFKFGSIIHLNFKIKM